MIYLSYLNMKIKWYRKCKKNKNEKFLRNNVTKNWKIPHNIYNTFSTVIIRKLLDKSSTSFDPLRTNTCFFRQLFIAKLARRWMFGVGLGNRVDPDNIMFNWCENLCIQSLVLSISLNVFGESFCISCVK